MKTVCVSLKELYKVSGEFLELGGRIDFYSEEDSEFYDLRTDDDITDDLLACDGELFYVLDDKQETIALEHVENQKKIYLTRREYEIAVFK